MTFREMDNQVTYVQQLHQDDGPVVLTNQFNLAPEGLAPTSEARVNSWLPPVRLAY